MRTEGLGRGGAGEEAVGAIARAIVDRRSEEGDDENTGLLMSMANIIAISGYETFPSHPDLA